MMNEGFMFTFHKDPYCRMPVFVMGKADRCVLWIGGQTESFLHVDYFNDLASMLAGEWSFVQTELASSRVGFGAQDHVHDAEDMDDLLAILVEKHGMKEVALFGTGTGLQVILELLENGRHADAVTRVILHGVVCDPESPLFTDAGVTARREYVSQLLADGRQEDSRALLHHYDMSITPSRLSSGGFPTLQEAVWVPAFYSDAVTVQRALGVVRVPLLLMIAHHVQYTPSDEHLQRVSELVMEAAGSTHVTLAYFHDTCDERRRVLKAAEREHVNAIVRFLRQEDKKRSEQQEQDRVNAIEDDKKRKSVLQATAFGVGASRKSNGGAARH